MRYSSTWAIAAAALAPVAWADDYSSQAATLIAQAVTFTPGDYSLTNVETGQNITFVDSGKQFFPAAGAAASLQFTNNPDQPFVRIGAGGKCLAAQWGYDEIARGIGADHAGVLYACAVGQDADGSSTLERTKQWWLFIPVAPSPSASATAPHASASAPALGQSFLQEDSVGQADVTNTGGCAKSQAWIQRHPQYVKGDEYYHPECASLLRSDQASSLGVSHLTRRAAAAPLGGISGGTYYIVTFDHLSDMATRYLTGASVTIEGDLSTELQLLDTSNALQQWIVTASQ